ncbi:MAG: DUF1385 domain-containing protein [Clostridium sp.]
MSKNINVGGQAVIEGVMMRGQSAIAIAVRKPDGEIAVKKDEIYPLGKKYKLLALPFIRGFVNLIESLVVGIKALNYSSTFFEDDEEPSEFDKWMNRVFKDKTGDVLIYVSLILSVAFSTVLFFILPTTAANIFKKIGFENVLGLNILEGCIRVTIFITYIYLIGKMQDIKRVFQYHGAEHKTIFCYENGVELTPENAAKFGRLHPRCGTNFMFLVMIVSIILFTFTGWGGYLERIFFRILLLPIVSGITYEIIKWMGKSESKISKIMSYPGLMLQKLTTQEPDLKQLEVAILSLKVAEGIE